MAIRMPPAVGRMARGVARPFSRAPARPAIQWRPAPGEVAKEAMPAAAARVEEVVKTPSQTAAENLTAVKQATGEARPVILQMQRMGQEQVMSTVPEVEPEHPPTDQLNVGVEAAAQVAGANTAVGQTVKIESTRASSTAGAVEDALGRVRQEAFARVERSAPKKESTPEPDASDILRNALENRWTVRREDVDGNEVLEFNLEQHQQDYRNLLVEGTETVLASVLADGGIDESHAQMLSQNETFRNLKEGDLVSKILVNQLQHGGFSKKDAGTIMGSPWMERIAEREIQKDPEGFGKAYKELQKKVKGSSGLLALLLMILLKIGWGFVTSTGQGALGQSQEQFTKAA